jgi:hypothetical protein
MPSRSTAPPTRRRARARQWLSRTMSTIVLLVLVIGVAFVVVAIRMSPAPEVSRDSSRTSVPTSTQTPEPAASSRGASAAHATAAPTGSSASEEAGTSVVPSTAPQLSTTPVVPVVPRSRSVSALSMQWGIQVYLHDVPAPGAEDNVDAILDYVVGLGANSLAVTFPLYTDGPNPSRVYRDVETPSPTRVADVVARAHDRGLRVTVRPIIDEENIAATPGEWRGSIEPVDVGAWFDSYRDALRPYYASGADEFVIAAELNSLQHEAEQWSLVEREARSAFPGVISYTFNWDGFDAAHLPMLTSYGIDLYPVSDLGDDATVEQLFAVMLYTLAQQPEPVRRSLVIHEVGIPALSGVYQLPYHWGTEGDPINEEVQAKWFTAACRAANESGVQGLYFWMLDSNVDPLRANPADLPPQSFVGRLAEASIRDCFAR